ncbi:MAG: VOC family protein [Deltaproteobacteria bacterium]|jgi:PhnB protein|nr:MAG: VOC family protein [Deltaproteobacteria bacterium]
MAAKVKSIPDEYRGATPYLCVKGAATAIDFYKNAFGAREVMRIAMDEGKIGHAELRVGDAPFMLADEFPEMNFRSPQSIGGTPVNVLIYVDDVDALVKRAESAGAKVLRQPEDQFYGDRMATLEDPYGHSWSFATHIEDVSPDEMRKRAAAHQT